MRKGLLPLSPCLLTPHSQSSLDILESTLTSTMAFNGLLSHIASLVTSDAEVADSVPCKSDVLTLRDCVKGASKEVSRFSCSKQYIIALINLLYFCLNINKSRVYHCCCSASNGIFYDSCGCFRNAKGSSWI